MLDVFITEAATVFADGKAHAMAAGLVIGARVFGVESPDRISAFYTDWHGGASSALYGRNVVDVWKLGGRKAESHTSNGLCP